VHGGREYSLRTVAALAVEQRWLILLPAAAGLALAAVVGGGDAVPVALSAGLATGLVLGLALVALREYRTATLSSAVEASRLLGVPVLGVVPLLRTARETRAARARRLAVDALGCLAVLGAIFLTFWLQP